MNHQRGNGAHQGEGQAAAGIDHHGELHGDDLRARGSAGAEGGRGEETGGAGEEGELT